MDEQTQPETYHLDGGAEIRLPIGVEKDGARYNAVTIDKIRGIDEEELSKGSNQADPGGALSTLLQRVVQSIPGVLDEKPDEMKRAPRNIIDTMYQADRDTLILGLRIRSYGHELKGQVWVCEECGEKHQEDLDLRDIVVVPWAAGRSCELPFEMPDGLKIEGTLRRKGTIRLPTGVDSARVSKLARSDKGGAVSAMLASLITDFDGVKVDRSHLQRMLSSDREYLGEVFRESLPGPRFWFDRDCSKCGEQGRLTVDVSSFFSRTRRRS